MNENKIQPVPDFEVGRSQKMCEIRFDCLVTMYEMGVKTERKGLFVTEERKRPPQWFKNECSITLEAIKHSNEYELGRQLKQMLYQLESHIRNYEES